MKLCIAASVMMFLVLSTAWGQQPRQQEKIQSALVATATINVPSIQCRSCVSTVQKALRAVKGVETARVDLKKKIATVTYASSMTSLEALETAVTKVGYAANERKADPEAYEKLDDCCKMGNEEH
jgi:copper chaperone CopZ